MKTSTPKSYSTPALKRAMAVAAKSLLEAMEQADIDQLDLHFCRGTISSASYEVRVLERDEDGAVDLKG